MTDYRDTTGKSKSQQTGGLLSGIGGAIGDATDAVDDAVSGASGAVDDAVDDATSSFSSFDGISSGVSDAVDDASEAVGDAVDDVDVPDVDVPDVDVPDVDVPEVDVPDFDVPDVDVPDIDVPDIDVPDIDTPDFDDQFDDATDVFEDASSDIDSAFDSVDLPSQQNISDTFDEAVSGIDESVGDVFDDAISDVSESASSVFDDASSGADNIFDTVDSQIDEAVSGADSAFDDAVSDATEAASEVDEAVGEFADSPLEELEDAQQAVGSEIDDAFSGVEDAFGDFTEDPVGEISEEVNDVANTVRDLNDRLSLPDSPSFQGGGLGPGLLVNSDLGEDLKELISSDMVPTAGKIYKEVVSDPLTVVDNQWEGFKDRVDNIKFPNVKLPSAGDLLSGAVAGNPFGYALQQFANGNIQELARGLNQKLFNQTDANQGETVAQEESPYGNDGGHAWGKLQVAKELEGCVIMKQEAQDSNATRYFTVAPQPDSNMLEVIGPDSTARVSEESFGNPDSLPYWIGESTNGRSAYDLAIEACPEYDPQEQGDPEDRFDGPRDDNERGKAKDSAWSNDIQPVDQTESCAIMKQTNNNGEVRYLTAGKEQGQDVFYNPDGTVVPVEEGLEWSDVEGRRSIAKAKQSCPGYEQEQGEGSPPPGGSPPPEEDDGGDSPEEEEEEDPNEGTGGDSDTEWRKAEEVRTTDGGCVLFRQLSNSGDSRYFTFTQGDGVLLAVDEDGSTTQVKESNTAFDDIPSFNRISTAEKACSNLPRNSGSDEDTDSEDDSDTDGDTDTGSQEPQEEQWGEPQVASETNRCVILSQESNMGNTRFFTITKVDGEKVALVPGSDEAVTLSGDESFSQLPSFTTLQAAQDACPATGEKPSEDEVQEETDKRDNDDSSSGLGLGGLSAGQVVGGLTLLGVGGAVVLGSDKEGSGMSSMKTGNDEGLFGDNGKKNKDKKSNNGSNNNGDNSDNGPQESLFGE